MSVHISLSQAVYKDAYYDNGTLTMIKRTGDKIKHTSVPQSVFYGFNTSGNTDSYYENHIKNIYPIK